MKFGLRESKDLVSAGLLLSLAFAILLSGGLTSILRINSSLPIVFAIAFLTAGIGFLLHEIMHKFIAQKYGFWAEFRAFYPMLWIALGLSFFGFIFAAPGAVFIRGAIDKEKNGKISLAGPITNIVLAIIFLIILLRINENTLLETAVYYGFYINSLLALFNMIPAIYFDGAKILAWNKAVYVIVLLLALGLFASSYFFNY